MSLPKTFLIITLTIVFDSLIQPAIFSASEFQSTWTRSKT